MLQYAEAATLQQMSTKPFFVVKWPKWLSEGNGWYCHIRPCESSQKLDSAHQGSFPREIGAQGIL
jgi:hypothetical protein